MWRFMAIWKGWIICNKCRKSWLSSFKYKSSILGNQVDDGTLKNTKIVVPLKHSSSFWRSLEASLMNSKIHLELNWTKNCKMSDVAGITEFKINPLFPVTSDISRLVLYQT